MIVRCSGVPLASFGGSKGTASPSVATGAAPPTTAVGFPSPPSLEAQLAVARHAVAHGPRPCTVDPIHAARPATGKRILDRVRALRKPCRGAHGPAAACEGERAEHTRSDVPESLGKVSGAL